MKAALDFLRARTLLALILLLVVFVGVVELVRPGTVTPLWASNAIMFAAPLAIMGGGQTLYVSIPHLDKFAYIGVYSSGLFGIAGAANPGRGGAAAAAENPGPNPVTVWEEQNKANLDNPALKKGLKLFWFSTGKDDGLITTSKATVELLKKHGFDATFEESTGAHTWINWRNYLNEFAPKLFQ